MVTPVKPNWKTETYTPSKAPSHTDESEKKDEKEEITETIQQVYFSTPDGLELRFGQENDSIIVRMKKPGVENRTITYHYILRLLSNQNYECLNYEGLGTWGTRFFFEIFILFGILTISGKSTIFGNSKPFFRPIAFQNFFKSGNFVSLVSESY